MASIEITNEKDQLERHSSIVSAPPASAFGDDDEDYRRVTKQQNDDLARKKNGTDTNFGKATFSKAPKGFEETQLAISEIEKANSAIGEDKNSAGDNDRDSSDTSNEQSTDDNSQASDTDGTWQKFAHTKFQVKSSNSYCCAALPHPLLPQRDKADHLAALASWVTILRIMGDLPEVDIGESFAVAGQSKAVVQRVRDYFHRRYTKRDIEDAYRKYQELFKDPVGNGEHRDLPFLPDNRESMLEKVQYVTALGIYRAELRDELYCQVCKQLTNNPSRNSTIRGWVLLFMFSGSFLPSEKFAPVFLQFLRDGPTEHAQRVERLLRRTFMVGTRGQPPSWLEFQAAKNSKPILVPVILMTGTRLLLETDTATTVNELCGHISQKVGLEDRSGFSVYITLGTRIACLGHGLHRIMDAIAECEQHTREQGMRESSSSWRLYFRREFFTPWHEAGADLQATELTYTQIMRGVSVGEYKCEKENVLIMMAAQKYYIEYDTDTSKAKMESFLTSWIPKEHLEAHDIGYWVDKLKTEIDNDFLHDKPQKVSLKADIVTFAMNKWYNLYSRFYDVHKVHGPNGSWNDVIIGINCKGYNIMDESENVKVHLSFIEIANVTKGRHSVVVSTLQGDDYTATTHHCDDLYTLLTSFQLGLRRRSTYAVTVQDASHFESAVGFGLAKGDLVKLDKPYEEYGQTDVYTGTALKNNKHGGLPRDVLYILPTIEEPPANIMGMLAVRLRKDAPISATESGAHGNYHHHHHHSNNGHHGHHGEPEAHTLHGYSKVFFRQPSEKTAAKLLSKVSLKRKDKDACWKFSRDALKKPLLRRTNMREELRRSACHSFSLIQRYMGDGPGKEDPPDSELLNDFVIDVAMRNKHLRDEIFCQLIKQLTQNPNKICEERGWQLLWLLLSCTFPQSDLYDELELFLKTNPNVFAKRCLSRLHATKSVGCRYTPPHPLEYEALTKRHPAVEYVVLYPDQTKQIIEVTTDTKMNDIHANIVSKLTLKNPEEYGLFFGLKDKDSHSAHHDRPEKVLNVMANDHFFDYLTHLQRYYTRQTHRQSVSQDVEGMGQPPVLIFMKKLWVNSTPGQDKLADIKFHFPQEMPNYLRGYHKCTPEEAVDLASLLFRAKYENEAQPFENIQDILPSLLPKSVLVAKQPHEWKKVLQESIKKLRFPTKEDAKVAFLKVLHKKQTYGSVFFEVKQRSTKAYPKNMIVAVNPSGVIFIDAASKDVLVVFSFDKVPNWAFDDFSFTLVIGEGSSISKVYMETNVGHNMDDLIMSYVAYIMTTQIKKKPSYAGIIVGESSC